ncbi:hypothetical protein [Microbacterium dauci]|uniref:Uncharacterized protein n=1 Tax=Microbacterium dauci TaxID=3048008 RepID=A0ABT6ZCD4_9MICO|nr:hypothetical protein [Microbacterium sp. LX3-4]MDJ1113813.1 hypothetical protein [Microbacterium sp. LX3-4]
MTSPHEVCLWVTPKIFDDLRAPEDGVAAFFDHHAEWIDGNDLTIVFCAGNGDHVLDWRGPDGLDDTFDWARYNAYAWDPDTGQTFETAMRNHNANWLDRVREGGERSANPYSAGPMMVLSEQELDYRSLAHIYATIREEAQRRSVRLRLLEYLEPGPEFCRSEWKTIRHPEVAAARADAGGHEIPGLIDVTLPLNADSRSYAGWPDGIPEGTLAGEFVARQTAAFVADFALDGVLLGNQFGLLGFWNPKNAPELTVERQEGIRRFFLGLRDAMGDRQIYWMDSYWRADVERDVWGMTDECYDALDAIVVSTFAVLVERTEIIPNLQSKARMRARTLYAVDFVDPWYAYRTHLDDIRSYQYQREVLRSHRDLTDGVTFFANDTFGQFVPRERLEETRRLLTA